MEFMTRLARPIWLGVVLLLLSGCEVDDGSGDLGNGGGNENGEIQGNTVGGTTGEPTAEQTDPGSRDDEPSDNVGASLVDSDSDGIAGAAPIGPPPDDGQSANNYEPVGTNPFILASSDPWSTFAADVDTASYDIFRRSVEQQEQLPHPDSVRLEEFVNAFTFDYPAPNADDVAPFTITLAAAPSPVAQTVIMSVGIQSLEVPQHRKPASLVFLIDTSGSMASGDKLPLVQTILTETLDILVPGDLISIVTYAGSTRVRLEPTPVSERAAIEEVINSLDAGGSTAGASGIDLAYQQAEEGFLVGGLNHILLLTDGDFNVGASSTDELVELIELKRESGITLTVLGFGWGNLNDSLMEGISNAGNGIYGVITDEDHAIEYVHEDMLNTLIHIAKDVKIQVEFNPDEVFAYRLLGYENRFLRDDQFRDDTVDAGEVGSGMSVTALYELVLIGESLPQAEGSPELSEGETGDDEPTVLAGEFARVRIRYKALQATADDPADEVLEILQADAIGHSFAEAPSDLQWAAAVAAFAEIIKESPYAQPDALDEIEAAIDANVGLDSDREEFQTLFGLARDMLETAP